MSTHDWPDTQARGPQFTNALGDALAEHNIGPRELAKLAAALYRNALREFNPAEKIIETTVSTTTDASGNGLVKLFDVPAGQRIALHRVTGEMAGATPASAVTVSNPAGNGWIGIFEVAGGATVSGLSTLNGALRDFGPATAAGALFPFVMTDGRHQAWAFRGGTSVWFACFSAKTSTQIYVAARGSLQTR